ncbi:MAG TPA: YkvA family protein [Mesorhizobium sp.]
MVEKSNFGFSGFGGKPGNESEVRAKFWRTARKAARQIPFMEEVVAAYYCALDKKTPLRAKAILLAALGYFVLPADAIPDIIFGLGFTDDIAVLTAAITAVRAHITPAHRLAAKEAIADET